METKFGKNPFCFLFPEIKDQDQSVYEFQSHIQDSRKHRKW